MAQRSQPPLAQPTDHLAPQDPAELRKGDSLDGISTTHQRHRAAGVNNQRRHAPKQQPVSSRRLVQCSVDDRYHLHVAVQHEGSTKQNVEARFVGNKIYGIIKLHLGCCSLVRQNRDDTSRYYTEKRASSLSAAQLGESVRHAGGITKPRVVKNSSHQTHCKCLQGLDASSLSHASHQTSIPPQSDA